MKFKLKLNVLSSLLFFSLLSISISTSPSLPSSYPCYPSYTTNPPTQYPIPSPPNLNTHPFIHPSIHSKMPPNSQFPIPKPHFPLPTSQFKSLTIYKTHKPNLIDPSFLYTHKSKSIHPSIGPYLLTGVQNVCSTTTTTFCMHFCV